MSASVTTPVTTQAAAWLDLFLDVVHGDVVLADDGCRTVGGALVDTYEPTLRSLTSSGALSASLEKALDTYCIRHLLLIAPEVLRSSKEVAQALLQLAQRLREEVHGEGHDSVADSVASGCVEAAAGVSADSAGSALPTLGRALEAHIKSLRKRLSTAEYARCMDVLADIVSGYMVQAAQEMEAEEAAQMEPGAPWRGPPSAQTAACRHGVQRFAQSVARHRALRKRAREEAVGQMAEELLFPSPQQPQQPQAGFAGELRAAMDSPDHTRTHSRMPAGPPPQGTLDGEADVKAEATPPATATRRRVQAVDSSAQRGVQALEESLTPPLAQPARRGATGVDSSDSTTAAESSVLVVDITTSPRPPTGPGRRGVQVAGTEMSLLTLLDEVDQSQHAKLEVTPSACGGEEDRLSIPAILAAQGFDASVIDCVSGRAPEVRTYFLSSATGRFEPAVAKGFFE